MLTASSANDVKAAPALFECAASMRSLLGEEGDDANRLRMRLQDAGTRPIQSRSPKPQVDNKPQPAALPQSTPHRNTFC